MKKVFAVIIAISVILSCTLSFSSSATAYSSNQITLYPYDLCLGDADNNGAINIDDACEIQRYIALLQNNKPKDISNEWYTDITDVDRNGVTSVFDVTLLQQYLADINPESYGINTVLFSRYQRLLQATESLPDVEVSYFDAVKPQVRDYLSNPETPVTDYCLVEFNLDKPNSYKLSIPADSEKIYIIDTVSKTGRSYSVESDYFTIKNLIPGRLYRYIFSGKNNNLIKAGECCANGKLRMIDAGGSTFNIRDLGGWSCDGGTLKYGMVYRGCELNGSIYKISLSESQRLLFTGGLGIRDEIDLRSDYETSGDDGVFGTQDDIKSSALGSVTDYERFTVAPYSGGIDLNNTYQTECYARLIKRIAKDVSENKPCYIHCLVGADRTGTICALIEAICGVPQKDIEHDYELTSFAFGNIRQKSNEEWLGLIDYLSKMDGNSLRDKAVSYALKSGVTKQEINLLRNALIDGNPEIL